MSGRTEPVSIFDAFFDAALVALYLMPSSAMSAAAGGSGGSAASGGGGSVVPAILTVEQVTTVAGKFAEMYTPSRVVEFQSEFQKQLKACSEGAGIYDNDADIFTILGNEYVKQNASKEERIPAVEKAMIKDGQIGRAHV